MSKGINTAKVYYDTDGNERTIWQMVKLEPEWAANRIQEGEHAVERLKTELNCLLDRWNDIVAASGSKTHGGAVGRVVEMAERERDLSILVARLAYALSKADPNKELAHQATEYLKRHDLLGSITRNGEGHE